MTKTEKVLSIVFDLFVRKDDQLHHVRKIYKEDLITESESLCYQQAIEQNNTVFDSPHNFDHAHISKEIIQRS
jgi:hypothetical protein